MLPQNAPIPHPAAKARQSRNHRAVWELDRPTFGLRIVKRRNKSRRVGRDLLQFLARSHVFPHVVADQPRSNAALYSGRNSSAGLTSWSTLSFRRCGGPADRAK